MSTRSILSSALAALGLCTAAPAETPVTGATVVATLSGNPLYVTHAPGDYGRIFVITQSGNIHIVRLPSGTLEPTPFMIVPDLRTGGETGLLGLAFHPNYASNGYFYIYYNYQPENGRARVERYTRSAENPDLADLSTAQVVFRTGGGGGNHNGGWICFGLDGYLYISIGESGNASNAQDLTENLLGKMLRIDVDGDDFPDDPEKNYRVPPDNPYVATPEDDEIWLAGLRNPWRCGIDRATGDIFVGDVGQSSFEEIDFIPAGMGGLNCGWPCYEGNEPFSNPNNCPPSEQLTFPIFVYGRSEGTAVVGGEVYRGCAVPDLDGRYFFADNFRPVRSFRYAGGAVSGHLMHEDIASSSPGFGLDAYGEIYVCRNGVRKIVPTAPVGRDCNANGVPDRCDIAAGTSPDADGDGVPDECGPAGDVTHDGHIDLADLATLLSGFGACAGEAGYNPEADFAGSGCVGLEDLAVLLMNFGS